MAKILLISDLHLRATTPQGRIDSFQETMWKKFKFIIETAKKENCDAILQAGDFFDKPDPPYWLTNTVISFLSYFDPSPDERFSIYTIYGQHDLYMRNQDMSRTAFGTLEVTERFLRLSNENHIINDLYTNQTHIYGTSFGKEIPNPEYPNEFNILVIHAMIGNKPLYPGHEYTDASKFLNNHLEYQIILCGDYHYPFHIIKNGRHIVNTGCMLRMTRDERDMNREPHFYIVDTKSNHWDKIIIPHKLAFVVFSEKKDDMGKPISNEGELLRFIQYLKQKGKTGIRYMDVLQEYVKKNEISDEVVQMIVEALE